METILKTPIFEFWFLEKSSPVSGLPSRCPYASLRVLGLKSWASLLRRAGRFLGGSQKGILSVHIPNFFGKMGHVLGCTTHILPIFLLFACCSIASQVWNDGND